MTFNLATTYGMWAGFTDSAVEGEWRWIDDTPGIWQDPDNFANPIQTAYTSWDSGEPNDFWGEDHLLVNVPHNRGVWNDGRGWAACPYIVEYEPLPEPATSALAMIAAALVFVVRWRRCG